MSNYIIVDGTYNCYRSVFMGGSMSTASGIKSGGAYIFLKMLYNLREHGKIVCIFDSGHAQWRKELYPEYKKREPKPDTEENRALAESFQTTFAILKDLLPRMGIPVVTIPNNEADDIVFRLGQALRDINHNVTVCSEDNDYLQMINFGMKVFKSQKDELWNKDTFVNKYEFDPQYFTLYKSLHGDGSDNISGIKGIGEETAAKIIKELKEPSLVGLLEWTSSLPISNLKKKVKDNFALIKRNMLLMDLQTIPLSKMEVFEEYQRSINEATVDYKYVVNKFNHLEFRTLNNWLSCIGK
jgi:5'-3' exonuclease